MNRGGKPTPGLQTPLQPLLHRLLMLVVRDHIRAVFLV